MSLARIERLIDSDVLGVATGTGYRVDDANDAFLALIGCTREDLEAGRIDWRAITPPEYAPDDDRALREMQRRGRCTAFEKAYLRKDGTRVPVLVGATALDPAVRTWICFVLDLTARQQAEAALRASEARFRVAQDLSLDAFTMLRAVRDGAGRIVDFEWTYVNEAAARILRHPAAYLVGRRLLEVLPGNRDTLFPAYVRIVETGEPHDIELRYRSEGIDGWFRNMAVRADDGVAVSFRDITGQKRADAELRESQARFEAFMAHLPATAYIKDEEGRYLFVNRHWEQVVGRSAADTAGRTDLDLFSLDVARGFRANDRLVRERGEALETDEHVPCRRGVRTYRTFKFPIPGSSGRSLIGGISIDVTERKRIEDEQRLLAESSRALVSSLDARRTLASIARLWIPRIADACAIDLLTDDGAFECAAVAHVEPVQSGVVREMRRRFPIDPGGTHPVAVAVRSRRPQLVADVSEAELLALSASPEQTEFLRRLGPRSMLVVPLLARGRALGTIQLVMTGSGRRFRPADVPLVEEVARRAALAIDNARLFDNVRRAEARFRDLVDNVDAIVWEADARSRKIAFVSRRIETMLGYPVERWLEDPAFWRSRVHPEDRQRAAASVEDGVARGDHFQIEYRVVAADGRVVWVRDGIHVVAREGHATRMLGVAVDITAEKEAEAEREELLLREQAARAEAQAATRAREMFLARASHELRTPLTSVLASVRLLRRAIADPERHAPVELVEMASRNLSAILALLNDLLDASSLASGTAPLALEPVSVADVVLAAKEAVEPQAREKGVTLDSAVPEALVLEGDPLKLLQVFTNLLGNAIKFTPSGGEAMVEGRMEGGEVVVRVRDTGEGISREHLAEIFEPFSQVARKGRGYPRGTGLGLAICRQIVTLHGGRIWAESLGIGKGSTFVAAFPMRQRQKESAA